MNQVSPRGRVEEIGPVSEARGDLYGGIFILLLSVPVWATMVYLWTQVGHMPLGAVLVQFLCLVTGMVFHLPAAYLFSLAVMKHIMGGGQ